MNSKLGLIVGVLVIVILVVLAFNLKGLGGETASTTPKTVGQITSLRGLLAGTVPQECSFADQTSDTKVTGKVYVANGKVRGDFSAETEGAKMVGHMILSQATVYSWLDGQTQGVRIPFDPAATAPSAEQENGLSLDKQLDYSCQSWAVNESLFTLPTTVSFTDFGAMMIPSGATAPAEPS